MTSLRPSGLCVIAMVACGSAGAEGWNDASSHNYTEKLQDVGSVLSLA